MGVNTVKPLISSFATSKTDLRSLQDVYNEYMQSDPHDTHAQNLGRKPKQHLDGEFRPTFVVPLCLPQSQAPNL